MGRLTMRNSDGTVSQPLNLRWADALERLAAYEDAGLEPEAVAELKKIPEIFNCSAGDLAQLKQLLIKLEDWAEAELAARKGDAHPGTSREGVWYSYNRAGLDWLGEQLGVKIYDVK